MQLENLPPLFFVQTFTFVIVLLALSCGAVIAWRHRKLRCPTCGSKVLLVTRLALCEIYGCTRCKYSWSTRRA